MGRRTNDSDQGTGSKTGQQNGNTSPTTAESGRAGTTETAKPSEKIPRLVSVDIPGEEPTEEPKRGRGRPKGSTKKAAGKKAVGKKPDTTNLKMLMLTVSGIVASRPGMEVWALSPQEIDQIAEPLAAIMARHNVTEATGEYADYIALVMACFIIFAPKYMQYKASKPKKEKVKKHEQSMATTRGDTGKNTETATSRPANREVKRTPSSNGPALSGNLYSLLPAIDG